jgi:predicted DsbA family dithiol-disulfide isomerase
VQLEIFSDVVCPWCYVGHARLQQALAARPGAIAEITWLPFELNPNLPEEGRDRAEYLRERFGDVNRFADAQRQLVSLGATLGIDFRFDAVKRSPNTRRAHVLAALARRDSAAMQHAVIEKLFAAYFTEGRDVGDRDVLLAIADECGLERDVAQRALADSALHAEVESLEALARSWNVSGVPTFIFDRRTGFSGAQPLEVFLQVIDDLGSQSATRS